MDDSRVSDTSFGIPVQSARHRGHHKFEIKATGEAAKNYDFKAARPPKKRTNTIETVANLAKTCLGGGVVAIHESYKMCGLWTSFVLTIVFGFCISYAMYMIAHSAQRMYGRVQVPAMSYPDLAEATLEVGPFDSMRKFSKAFRYLVDFTICFNLFGSCCVYQIMMARTIKQLVEGTNEVTLTGNPPLRVYILVLVVPCILLGMITSLKYLAPFSIVADFMIFTVACATVYYCSRMAEQSPLDMPAFKTFTGLFEFMGVCIFSMEGLGAVMAIENNMEEPRKMGLALLGALDDYTKRSYNILRVLYWYNNAIRILLKMPRYCSASGMFASAGIPDFYAVIRNRIAGFWEKVCNSSNKLIRGMAHVSPDNMCLKHWLKVHQTRNTR